MRLGFEVQNWVGAFYRSQNCAVTFYNLVSRKRKLRPLKQIKFTPIGPLKSGFLLQLPEKMPNSLGQKGPSITKVPIFRSSDLNSGIQDLSLALISVFDLSPIAFILQGVSWLLGDLWYSNNTVHNFFCICFIV